MIKINEKTVISEDEFIYKASRSGGPGGQNVNKVNTRVTVLFDVADTDSLSGEQKQRILSHLATRTGKDGVLRVVSQKHRTQKANRMAATERLVELLKEALEVKPVRKKTKVPYRKKQLRLEKKKRRSIVKDLRKKIQ